MYVCVWGGWGGVGGVLRFTGMCGEIAFYWINGMGDETFLLASDLVRNLLELSPYK